jgi:hypothetical protein
VAFSPDERLASGSEDRTVNVWDLRQPDGQPLTLRAHTDSVWSVAFSPDGQRLFSTDHSGKVVVWNPRSGERLAEEKPPAAWSGQGAQSPDGKLLALCQADGGIDLVELRPPSEAEVLYRRWKSAFDPVWQEEEATRHEKAEQWFAAAFHLRQLLAHKPRDADKVQERLKRCEKKLRELGTTEPASATLEAHLVAKQDTYTLDRGGKSPDEYARQVRAAANRGEPLPTPRVELTLVLRNTGDKEIKILVGGDGPDVMLDLQGPGAVRVQPNRERPADFRPPSVVAIAPGKSHVLSLSNFSFGDRGSSDLAYWTKPGDYRLTATYRTSVSPMPKGAQKDPYFSPDFGHVAATSAPIKLTVIEKQ